MNSEFPWRTWAIITRFFKGVNDNRAMGLRSFLKRFAPKRQQIEKHRHLQVLGYILHEPNIFHLTRRSAAGGVAVGLFLAFIPLPGQMLLAVLLSLLFRVNMPLAIACVWLSNPVTIAPLFFLAHKTGGWLLNAPVKQVQFEPSMGWLAETLAEIWQPLLLGSLTLGTLAALAGYTLIRLLWRLSIVRQWEERKALKNNS